MASLQDRKARLEAWRRSKKGGVNRSGTCSATSSETLSSEVLTPVKLACKHSSHNNNNKRPRDEKENNARHLSTSIRAKVAESAKKRKQTLEDRRKELLRTAENKCAEAKAAEVSQRESREKEQLDSLVDQQVEVVEGLIKNKKFKEARDFLKQLHGEIPACTKAAGFWTKLAQLEMVLGNRVRTGNVFIHAMKECNDQRLLDQCCEFMKQELFKGIGFFEYSLENLLGEEEEGEAFGKEEENEEDPLIEMMRYNPHTNKKPAKRIEVTEKRPESILKSGAKRVRTHSSPSSTAHKSSVKRPKKNLELEEGSFVTMASIKNRKKSETARLGSERAMTPVRRSARLHRNQSQSSKQILQESNFAYTPNQSLQAQQDELV